MSSNHKYINDPNNLFMDDDDDVDDETFLKNSRRRTVNPPLNNYAEQEQQRQTYLEKKQTIENRTIQSSERSISLLRDSEQIGIATAEELMRQREQLENTDRRLDEINATLRFSQKHINGIKSVFGSLKNYLSGRNNESPSSSSSSKSAPNNQSEPSKTNDYPEINKFDSHPVTRLRDLNHSDVVQTSASKNFTQILDANLDEMYGQIGRLKGLASDLSVELDTQNELIDNITDKSEVAGLTIDKQNKDMNRILKK